MTLAEAVHSEAGTFHSFAAACTSIMRAAAPPLRTYSFDWRTPRLPPVENSPQARLRATLWPGVGYSISTLLQSQSSSSAMSCARPVIVPWPISARTARIRVVLSGRIATQTVISGEPSAARTTVGPKGGRRRPSARPPPRAALPMRKVRRSILFMNVMSAPSGLGGHVDRFAHLLEGAAAADIGDARVDVGVGRLRLRLEERRHRHDHSGLAIAALRHVVIDPRLLHLVQDFARGQAFDRGDLAVAHCADRYGARAHRDAVDVHGAGAALRDAAAVLGAGEADLLADHPQQGRGRIDVDLVGLAVDCQAHCYSSNVVRGCGREMRIFAPGYPTPIIGSR